MKLPSSIERMRAANVSLEDAAGWSLACEVDDCKQWLDKTRFSRFMPVWKMCWISTKQCLFLFHFEAVFCIHSCGELRTWQKNKHVGFWRDKNSGAIILHADMKVSKEALSQGRVKMPSQGQISAVLYEDVNTVPLLRPWTCQPFKDYYLPKQLCSLCESQES